MKKHGKLKCILLKVKESICKVTSEGDSKYLTFWENQNYGDNRKDQWLPGACGDGEEGINREQRIFTERFYLLKVLFKFSIMMDTCHYIFIQTHRKYKTKSEPQRKLWTLGDNDVSV